MDDFNPELHEAMGADNFAETIARDVKRPETFESPDDGEMRHLLLPPGWKRERLDDEELLERPRRLKAKVALTDTESFIAYIKRHVTADDSSTIWCAANWADSALTMRAVLDDHAPGQAAASWREHAALYTPVKSLEWNRWVAGDRKPLGQVEFASWIEDNRRDIATVDGLPTAAQMFEMALNMEATQDVRFKSAIRLQSGGTQLQYVADEDAQTVERMQLFERFAIGIPVFWLGAAYKIEARLKYRMRDAKVSFWYELERADLTFQAAAKEIIEQVRTATGVPFFFGDPGLRG